MRAPRFNFYVYILFRLDTGAPFYVGKGCRDRQSATLREDRRNKHKQSIIEKMRALNLDVPAIRIADGISEDQAFEIEIALIAAIGRRRDCGPLANMTDGGEGPSGFTHTAEARQKISEAGRRRVLSPATLEKMSKSQKGRTFSPEHREKLRAKLKGFGRGRQVSESTRMKLSAVNKGRQRTAEQRKKNGDARKGKPLSEAHKARLRQAAVQRDISPELSRIYSDASTKRWERSRAQREAK